MQPLYRSPEESLRKLACLLTAEGDLISRIWPAERAPDRQLSSSTDSMYTDEKKGHPFTPSPSRSTTVKMLKLSPEQPSLAERKHYTVHQAHSDFSIRLFFLPMQFRFSPIHPNVEICFTA